MSSLKKNVTVFNGNVTENGGYLYTTNAPLSSILANKRMTDAILALIDDTVQTLWIYRDGGRYLCQQYFAGKTSLGNNRFRSRRGSHRKNILAHKLSFYIEKDILS
jgi:hypothetical protein